jgi:hypothetical protein
MMGMIPASAVVCSTAAVKQTTKGNDVATKAKAKPKAPSTDDLELTQAQAKKIVKLAIKHGAYSDEMPETKKDQIEAARESVAMCIDGWVSDEVRPDDDDEEIADAAKAILELFELAGIEVNDDDEIVMPGDDEDDDDTDDDDDDESDEDDSDDDDEDDEDEDGDDAPFDPDDYFDDGWSELSANSKIKVLKALDTDDEDDLAAIEAVHAWEKEQDKPTSRVLSWIEDNFDMSGDDDSDDDDDDEDDETVDGTAEEMEEPWKGYNKLTAVDVKKFLTESDELTAEQVQYVKEYEQSMKAPRKRILTLCDTLIEKLGEEDDEDEKPAKSKSKGALAGKRSKSTDPDDDDEVDEAVARDDAKDKRKKKSKASVYTVTYEMGDNTIEMTSDGMHAAMGAAMDAMINGAESVTIEHS